MKDGDFTYTQSGQPRAYADHRFVGTVEAISEADAKGKLAYRFGGLHGHGIDNPDASWASPKLVTFKDNENGTFGFVVIRAYTG